MIEVSVMTLVVLLLVCAVVVLGGIVTLKLVWPWMKTSVAPQISSIAAEEFAEVMKSRKELRAAKREAKADALKERIKRAAKPKKKKSVDNIGDALLVLADLVKTDTGQAAVRTVGEAIASRVIGQAQPQPPTNPPPIQHPPQQQQQQQQQQQPPALQPPALQPPALLDAAKVDELLRKLQAAKRAADKKRLSDELKAELGKGIPGLQ